MMALTIIVFPFPAWVQKSGYISFGFIALLFVVLMLMKKYRDQALVVLAVLLKPFPPGFRRKINDLLHSFLDGVVGLKRRRHYAIVALLPMFIWFCYGFIFQLGLYAFDFIDTYSEISWITPLVLLVITTIAVLVPSSPGYVGTYHWLCQISLGFFGVPESDALSFAFAVHGINFLPILLVGLILVSVMGMSVKTIQDNARREVDDIEKVDAERAPL